MDIEKYLAEKKPLIDREIEKVIPRKLSENWLHDALGKPDYSYDAESISRSTAGPIWDLLDRGGKRWRPGLTLLCCEAVGGGENDALPFTPVVELIHSGTLICDDVEDDSQKRRGKPCIHLVYGQDTAINTGCALYFIPLTLLYKNRQGIGCEKGKKIYDLYAEEMLRLSIGQATDIFWHKGEKQGITEQQYLQMVVNKTGVLARFAAKMGAILGNGSMEQIDALGKFGESVGIGFQIQDDILELTSGQFRKGKGSLGGDIHEGKMTLLVIKTLEKASASDKKRLIEILQSHASDEKRINEAIAIIKRYGAIEYAGEKANAIVENAWKEIDAVLPESGAKELLHGLALYCTKREI